MSINFGQFPTPRLPIQTGDFVVGYQLIGSVPTLAQYTMTQLFTGAFPGGVLPVSNGGTGLSTVPAGDLLVGTGTNTMNFIIPGTAGAMLISQGTSVSPQFANNPVITGGTITGVPISGGTITGTTGVTQPRVDNSTLLATDQFVNQQIISSTANAPFPLVGGTYNQATLGTGLTVVIFVSGGTISSILSVVTGGTGYAVGDLVLVPAGNDDAVLRITNVVGGVVQSGGVSVIYGGTGYTTGAQVTAIPVPPGQRTVTMTGVLTSNVTFIIQNGTFLTAARRVQFNNNTTGAFTVTVKLSNGAGGSVGTGVVLAQGTNNSTATLVETDGVNDVWLADTPLGIGALSSTNPVVLSGTLTPTQTGGIVGTTTNNNANAGSVGEFISANVPSGTPVALTTNVTANVTSISLTAGDWDVWGNIGTAGTGTTTVQNIQGAIATASATLPTSPNGGAYFLSTIPEPAGGTNNTWPTGTIRLSLAATTTVFLVVNAGFLVSTYAAYGFIGARRRR